MPELLYRGNPQMETERLILRRLELQDAEDVFDYCSVEAVSRYMSWDTHHGLSDARDYIRFTMGRYERDEGGDWGIVDKTTRRLIGTVGFAWCDLKNKRAEIGYVLAQRYWGQGMMPEAAGRVLRFAFEEMGLNRVESCHFLPNEKSGRVMQKLGMRYEGVARERIWAKGHYWDVKQYAILRSEWLERSKTKTDIR